MGRPLLPLLAALFLLACSNSGQPSAAASPSPTAPVAVASPGLTVRPPAALILGDPEVGLPRVATRDDVGLAQAASEQENQPLALTQYRAWGWLVESVRSWGGGPQRLDESLLLLTRVEGAVLAFQGWAGELTQRGACADALGVDQCALGSGVLVARVDRYVFRLSGSGVDLAKLARLQAGRIRSP